MRLANQQLGKYIIIEELGSGGMGTVYKGYDPGLDRYVAIKMLSPQLVREEIFVQRFLQEARAAAKLNHSSIVVIYEIGQESDLYYFAMEYVDGISLSRLIQKRKGLTFAEVFHITKQISSALDHAHQKGLIHRDVKSSNILIDRTSRAVLTDFGIVRAAWGLRLTSTGIMMGTPEYMSPEQGLDEEITPASDIYSLGVVVYEMLSGRVPYQASTPLGVMMKKERQPPEPLRNWDPGISEDMEKVVFQALARDPQDRPPSGAAFVDALRACPDFAKVADSQPVIEGIPLNVSTAESLPPTAIASREDQTGSISPTVISEKTPLPSTIVATTASLGQSASNEQELSPTIVANALPQGDGTALEAIAALEEEEPIPSSTITEGDKTSTATKELDPSISIVDLVSENSALTDVEPSIVPEGPASDQQNSVFIIIVGTIRSFLRVLRTRLIWPHLKWVWVGVALMVLVLVTGVTLRIQTAKEHESQASFTATAQIQGTRTAQSRQTSRVQTLNWVRQETATVRERMTATAAAVTPEWRLQLPLGMMSAGSSATATVSAAAEQIGRGDRLIYPKEGQLKHTNGGIQTYCVRQDAPRFSWKDFSAQVVFTNPSTSNQANWDYGFLFRYLDEENFLMLRVDSEQSWHLSLLLDGEWGDLQTGTFPSSMLQVQEGAQNTLSLVLEGETGYFFVNNEFVVTLYIQPVRHGDVCVAAQVEEKGALEGIATGYQDFTVWSIAH